jgi:hypothetical protein
MSRREKQYIIRALKSRYSGLCRRDKSSLLSEACTLLGVSRKHAIRLLSGPIVTIKQRGVSGRGRPSKYGDAEFKRVVRRVWRELDYPCGKTMKASIPLWLGAIEGEYGCFEESVHRRLREVSAPTLDRLLKPFKVPHGRSFTRSGGFREEIPIQGNIWDIGIPGYLEADTVALCGGSMAGEFINTITMVDIATLWTEVRAVFGRGSNATFDGIRDIERGLPFLVLGYDADNGGEVLNRHLYDYFFTERRAKGRPPVGVTRSRSYKKNDNAHVEQRNDAITRKYLGYERMAFKELVPILNYYLAEVVCPLVNFFRPSFKLSEKILIKSRTRRVYKMPQTPYQRLLESPQLSQLQKLRLKLMFQRYNPVHLSKEEKRIRKLIDTALRSLKAGNGLPPNLPTYCLKGALLSQAQPSAVLFPLSASVWCES